MTKKYSAVHPPLIERLMEENKAAPDKIKAVKTKLHQLYGAYTQDNAHKKANAIITTLESELTDIQSAALQLLALHASTKERLPSYTAFYDFILQHTGQVESIMDIGCGYNPFSIPLIPNKTLQIYHAYDIDTRTADLINRYFKCLNLPPNAQCTDLAVHTPPQQADLALILKLLPVLEAQAPGSGYKLARSLNTRYLLISYPLKSLGGREKGMTKNYSTAFEKALSDGVLGNVELLNQQQIGNELIYLLKNLPATNPHK